MSFLVDNISQTRVFPETRNQGLKKEDRIACANAA